ncbi:inorganic phosphate transporter [Cellulomonas sp. Root137]|uniref:inorganic phosphate transporter n=1 Tax=Cellulomonas sp. Root137 TaxID=1736459 RepID=UPI0006FB9E21|nr:inorganic phosphate transporter [Cellulomonas sp. Root137]KQY47078.1 inorganic phosphate transporter [Cellulomonas sp. Root137]KRD44221.1 inorganic phosphate transporter [Cellulomonas sp. Root930]
MELALVIVVVAFALGFDYTNGFHDAANAIATSVSTRALTPRAALIMAAVFNLVGALLGTQVATTIAEDIISISSVSSQEALIIVLSGLIGAITWNLITWRLGLPSSSTHALIGGLTGVGIASGVTVHWDAILDKVVIPMILSPFVGFLLAFLLMVGVLWLVRNSAPARTMRRFRISQTASAAAMALGHGLQDAQKTMGVIVLALVAGGFHTGDTIPLWVKLSAATAISLGTYSGGWRIMRTLGRKVIELDPARGFVAESVAASVLYASAYWLHAPISTTHTITSAIMGVGATKRLSAVRWGVAGNIGVAWVLTIPMAALVAACVYWILNPILT